MPQLTWAQMRHFEPFFVESIRSNPHDPVVIAEGDSWFSFPGHANLIDHLDEMVNRRMSLLRLAESGDELLEILDQGGLRSLKKLLGRYRPDVLLFSAGGNDIVGPELLKYVTDRTAPFDATQALATQALRDRFSAMHHALGELIATRDEVAPNCVIVTHGYGRAIPSGRKAQVWGFTAGPWIKPYLEARGYTDPGEQRAIVDELIGQFNRILDTFVGSNFVKVDLSGAIADDEWNDELHPSRKGFEDAALLVHAALRRLLPHKFS
ncbi:MAG TPA: hypothetical protein VGF28_24475 [Thermoanaerobaculia bacterium]|jgi:lysophospholipase L1-like esterase